MHLRIKRFLVFGLALCLCAATVAPSTSRAVSFVGVSRHAKDSVLPLKQISAVSPMLTATLNDAFPDPNGDGKAERGTEITYTATLTNNGTTSANNANFSVTLDSNLTYVENSTSVSRHNLPVVTATSPVNGATDVPVNSNILIAFNQAVNAGTNSFALECPVGTPKSFTVSGSGTNTITLTPAAALPGGTTCRVRVVASQISSVGNNEPMPADYVFDFSTVPPQAKLRLSEIAPNINSSRDLIELTVAQGGRTNGMTLVQDSTVLATLPDATVSTSDVIVLHFNPINAIDDAPSSETTSKNQYSTAIYAANYDTAWDFHAGTTGIAYSNRVLRIKDADGNTQDAVPFVRTAGTPPASFPNQLQEIQAEGLWLPANCGGALCTYTSTPTAVDVSAVWEGVGTTRTGNTVKRISAADTDTRDDWAVGANTLGLVNEFRANSGANDSKPAFGKLTDLEKNIVLRQAAPLTVNLGSILPNEVVVVTFRAVVNASLPPGTTAVSNQGTVTGDNFASINTDDPATPAASDATVTLIATPPTAASVSVGGRVLTSNGRGLQNAVVRLAQADGSIIEARTNAFGYYRFNEVAAGQTVIISIVSKRYQFPAQVVSVTEDLTDLNFFAELKPSDAVIVGEVITVDSLPK